MKNFFFIVGWAVVLGVLSYLLSPLWRNIELDESSPLPVTEDAPANIISGDSSYIPLMDAETKNAFEKQMNEMKGVVKEMNDAMPKDASSATKLLARGPFIARAHDVKGEALLIEDGGKKVLRFENFETINGPDVRIYLAADLQARDFVEISPIRATKGNVNYDIPAGVDTTKYDKVLVWCKAFGVLFSSAEF